MFFCSLRAIVHRKKIPVKCLKAISHVWIIFLHTMGKSMLEAWFIPLEQFVSCSIMMIQHPDKMQQICSIESSVFEGQQAFQVTVFVVNNKLVGCFIHQCHQFIAFVDDGGAVAPGKNGCKKSSNFDVGFLAKAMGDGDRIIFNKPLLVVPL